MVFQLERSKQSFLFLIALLFWGVGAWGQTGQNAEALFEKARKQAFDEKDYPSAIATARQALQQNSNYIDIYIFLGRLYAWQKNSDSSRYYFNTAIAKNPNAEDAYVGYADLELWNNNDSIALDVANRGLAIVPASVPLLLRKAKALNNERRYKEAIAITDTLLLIDRKNTEARVLSERIMDKISLNRIGVYAEYINFDKQFPDPWRLIYVDYTRQTGIGPVSARVNYANRFKNEGLQVELEAYPRISKTFCTYVNIGYADNAVFPRWRGGFSLYSNLPKGWETELGTRYLYFSSSTWIYTAYVGKYLGSFLVGARTYITPDQNKNISQAYSGLIRYYFGRSNNYVGLNLGAGISPDDRLTSYQLNNSGYKLTTYRAELNARYTIRQLNIFTLNASLMNQEYLPGVMGNQFQFGLGYARRF